MHIKILLLSGALIFAFKLSAQTHSTSDHASSASAYTNPTLEKASSILEPAFYADIPSKEDCEKLESEFSNELKEELKKMNSKRNNQHSEFEQAEAASFHALYLFAQQKCLEKKLASVQNSASKEDQKALAEKIKDLGEESKDHATKALEIAPSNTRALLIRAEANLAYQLNLRENWDEIPRLVRWTLPKGANAMNENTKEQIKAWKDLPEDKRGEIRGQSLNRAAEKLEEKLKRFEEFEKL